MTIALTLARPLPVARERIIIWFATIQLFAIVYLQKFALLGNSTPLSVPMLILFSSIGGIMLFRPDIFSFSALRLTAYLLFVFACLWSEIFSIGSLPSFMQVVVLYAAMTICIEVSEKTYMTILNRFVMFMLLPAVIVIEQYAYQKLTGHTDPLDMERVFPPWLLLQGYNYAGHFPWNSPFIRPNGFFFLEPSFVSGFTACAAIIEMTYFRRIHWVLLLGTAVLVSMGGTGLFLLVLAAPFLLLRERPLAIITISASAIIVLTTALLMDVHLPMLSRTDELNNQSSSASERLLLPAQKLWDYASDPRYIFMGDGAGAISPAAQQKSIQLGAKGLKNSYNSKVPAISPWPMVKLIQEYGLLSSLTFFAFFLIAVAGNVNLPLKVALSITYLFTGGYLLSPVMVVLVVNMCSMWKVERRT